jgi:hypothetical protein
MTRHQKKNWRIGRAAGALLLPAWFLWGYLEANHVSNPWMPLPARGVVAPYQINEITVYVTNEQQRTATWLFRFDVGIFATMIICAGMYRSRPRSFADGRQSDIT